MLGLTLTFSCLRLLDFRRAEERETRKVADGQMFTTTDTPALE